ncbi:MrpH family fimbial adhesin [Providencia sp. Me31A]|uniref:MrpH family fimbial adhesin n=1 Tax=Providencia sp. Me31A TaxID=3392637 RepID=UPI003D284CDA
MKSKCIRLAMCLIVMGSVYYPITTTADPIVTVFSRTGDEPRPGYTPRWTITGTVDWAEIPLNDPAAKENVCWGECVIGVCPAAPGQLCNTQWLMQQGRVYAISWGNGFSTLRDLRRAFFTYYKDWSMRIPYYQYPDDACFNMVYGHVNDRMLNLVPGTVCGYAPPLNVSCSVTSGDVNIEHNTIEVSKISNQPEIIKPIELQCTGGSAVVSFSLASGTTDDLINMGTGLKSQLTIDGKKLTIEGTTLSARKGRNSILLGSKLIASGEKIEPGLHKGSVTVLMRYN